MGKFVKNGDRAKNKILTLDIEMSGVTDFGENYDVNELRDILAELADIEVARLISIPVYGKRSELLSPDKKGSMVIGYLLNIGEDDTLKVAIYPKHAEHFDNDSYIRTRVMLDRREKYVRQIIGFDIVNDYEEVEDDGNVDTPETAE